MTKKEKRISPIKIATGSGLVATSGLIMSKKASKIYDRKLDKYAENVAAGKNRQRLINFFTGQNEIKELNKFYNKQLSKAYGGTWYGGGPGRFDPLYKRIHKIPTESYKASRYRVPAGEGKAFAMIYTGQMAAPMKTNVKNLPLMLHELAHRKQYKKGESKILKNKFFDKTQKAWNKSYTKSFNIKKRGLEPPHKDYTYFRGNKKIDKAKRKIAFSAKQISSRAFHSSRHKILGKILDIRRPLIEMEANIKAVKMAKKIRGPKFAKITAKAMTPNVLGYWKKPILKLAATGAAVAGAALISSGLKDKKKRKPRRTMKDVRFIRKNGRVIPIKIKK